MITWNYLIAYMISNWKLNDNMYINVAQNKSIDKNLLKI